MIFGVSQRALTATDFLRLPSAGHPNPAATKTGTLVAAWPALAAHTSPGDFLSWRAAQWADFLNAPLLDHPFTASPGGDRRALFRLLLALGPDDRVLNTAGWTYAAHTVLASLGLARPDGDGPHRWIAVRAHPRHLHLIANLISEDGTWAQLPEPLLPHLQSQVRLLAQTLNQPPASSAGRPESPAMASAPTPNSLADLLDEITDEAAGPLAQVRRQIEKAAISSADAADLHRAGTDRRLEWIARRLYDIQEDLRGIGHTLSDPASPPSRLATAPAPLTRPTPAPSVHAPAR
ncbi:relaxase/mobilization nuclease [Streptomyces sp. HPF1205]|uniref:relaxase/mobilization nuclease n=1 Tax=Streptomyces sp. HPF1205 TaxID=2873262 RepID=UPI001CEC84C2|nr:relaxase/mobilization nuclease [Streptomyces sp. HPF1205]